MHWLAKILTTLVRRVGQASPSCKEAARLQSVALDRRLTVVERLGLRFHLLFCKWCRAYGKQISFLSAAAKKREADESPAPPQPALSSEARERIKRTLKSSGE